MAIHEHKGSRKENIEIRFFASPAGARRLLKAWKDGKWKFDPYSFTDHYFRKGGQQAKVRVWRQPRMPTEIIFSWRRNGLKTEIREKAKDLKAAEPVLEKKGFDPYLTIFKKKAWLVEKRGMPTFAFELVPGIGWTGEMEVPWADRKDVPKHVAYLKSMGAKDFTKKSMLQIMEERMKRKR
ncbi:Uncharacterised protein [uncultured archaeon]|nr:Uncharacterised protein [uncultured archaeon]